ncbi:hypothetical protein VTG60DRAFT_4651 [Thermothelomyces hinnuleus]
MSVSALANHQDETAAATSAQPTPSSSAAPSTAPASPPNYAFAPPSPSSSDGGPMIAWPTTLRALIVVQHPPGDLHRLSPQSRLPAAAAAAAAAIPLRPRRVRPRLRDPLQRLLTFRLSPAPSTAPPGPTSPTRHIPGRRRAAGHRRRPPAPAENHFLYRRLAEDVWIPAAGDADATNSPSETAAGALGRHVRQCAAERGVGFVGRQRQQ